MIHKKEVHNAKHLDYLGSMVSNDARCTRETNSSNAMETAAFNKKFLFNSKLDLKFKEEGSETRRLRVFENRVLRRIFGPKRDDATGEWRRLHKEELNDLYSSPNIIRVTKLRMRWAVHVARMGKKDVHTGFWLGDLREGDHLGDPGVDGRIILKWIKTWNGAWIGLSCLRIGACCGLL
jgi:hypothetical protein